MDDARPEAPTRNHVATPQPVSSQGSANNLNIGLIYIHLDRTKSRPDVLQAHTHLDIFRGQSTSRPPNATIVSVGQHSPEADEVSQASSTLAAGQVKLWLLLHLE